jgi:hypothetical protein
MDHLEWNHLRKVWGPTPDTLTKIQVSCKTQENLEEANDSLPLDTSGLKHGIFVELHGRPGYTKLVGNPKER